MYTLILILTVAMETHLWLTEPIEPNANTEQDVVGICIKSARLFRFISPDGEPPPWILIASNERWLWQVLELEGVHISSISQHDSWIWATASPNVNAFAGTRRAVGCIRRCRFELCHLRITRDHWTDTSNQREADLCTWKCRTDLQRALHSICAHNLCVISVWFTQAAAHYTIGQGPPAF